MYNTDWQSERETEWEIRKWKKASEVKANDRINSEKRETDEYNFIANLLDRFQAP